MNKKKIIITLLGIMMIFTGCLRRPNYGKLLKEHYGINNVKEIPYDEGIYSNKNWDELDMIDFPFRTYSDWSVKNVKNAIACAFGDYENLFHNGHLFNNKDRSLESDYYEPKNTKVKYVFYDTEDEIWIVSFYSEDEEMYAEYGGVVIAMRKSASELLYVWREW